MWVGCNAFMVLLQYVEQKTGVRHVRGRGFERFAEPHEWGEA
jgi:hypothetical protein